MNQVTAAIWLAFHTAHFESKEAGLEAQDLDVVKKETGNNSLLEISRSFGI